MAYQIIKSSSGLVGSDVAYLLSCQPSVSPAFPTVLSRDPSAHRYWGVSDLWGNLPMQEEATSMGGDASYYARYYVERGGSCTFVFSFDGEHTYTLYSPWNTSQDPYPWGQAGVGGTYSYRLTSMTFSLLPTFYGGDREGVGFLTAKNSTYNDRNFTSVTFHQGDSFSISTSVTPGPSGSLPNTFILPVYQAIHRTITLSSNGAPIPDDSLIVYADDFPGFDNPIRGVTHSPPPLPTPTQPSGLIFEGWFTAPTGGTKVESIESFPSQDVTYYAHWSRSNVFAMLDAAGGTCDPAILELTVGGTYAALPTPTRPNYSFDGWFTAASGGTQVTSATTVTSTSNHTLYAHWTARSTPAQNGELIYDDASGRLIYDDRPVEEL